MPSLFMREHLAVVAPEPCWPLLQASLAPHVTLSLHPLPAPRLGADPYNLTALAQRVAPAGLLLVAPRRRAPRQLVPGLVVGGVPVGVVLADNAAHLAPWLQALASCPEPDTLPVWATLAMAKHYYLAWGERFLDWLQAGKGPTTQVQRWLADEVSREVLCERLATGPRLAIYAGHGRSRGWSGYRALRWEHVAAVPLHRPSGVLVSLACDTLKHPHGSPSFGSHWVNHGRACAYVGATEAVKIVYNAAFATLLGTVLAQGNYRTLGDVLRQVHVAVESSASEEARRGFRVYRLLGYPLQILK